MKIIIESQEDVFKLANWYNQGLITADIYFDAVERYSKVIVEQELKHKSAR